jgi:O-antigen ligase
MTTPELTLPWPPAPPAAPEAPYVVATTADRRWSWLLLCVAVYMLASVGRIHQLFPPLTLLRPALVSAFIAIALVMWSPATLQGVYQAFRFPTTKCVAGLLFWVAVSVPGALWPGGSVTILVQYYLKLAIMYLVLVAAVRGPRDVERLALMYFLSVTLYSAVVVVRKGPPLDRLGALYYYDANDFATLVVTALPLGVHFIFTRQAFWRRLIGIGGLAIMTLAFVWSGSRGGFIGLLVVAAFLLFGYTAIRASRRLFAAVIVTVALFGVAGQSYWERMRTILAPEQDYNMTEEGGRMQVWKRGIGYMLQRPVTGVGAGNFATAEGRLSPLAERQSRGRGLKWSAAHSSYVQVGAELGIPGLLLFLGLFLGAFRALRRAWPPPLAQALMGSLVGFLAGAVFLSLAYADMPYILLSLAIGLARVSPRPLEAPA